MKWTFAILLCLLGISANAQPWETVIEEDGIVVSARALDGKVLKEYRVSAEVDFDASTVLNTLKNFNSYKSWLPNTEKIEVLARKPYHYCYYMVKNPPWPVDQRDVVVGVRIFSESDGSVLWQMQNVEGVKEMHRGYVRTPYMRGHWKITPLTEKTCYVHQQVISEPGGYVPDWFVNLAIKEVPLKTMQGLINYMKQHN